MPRGNPIHSFYPTGGPSKYSYTNTFGDHLNRGQTADEAKANTTYPGLVEPSVHKFQVLYNLEVIMKDARKAELAFLRDTGIDISSEKITQQIFSNFNLILNSKQMFNRNLEILKSISENKNAKLIEPTKYFHTYLNQAIREHVNDKSLNVKNLSAKQLEKLLDKIMGDALEKTYSKCKEVIDKQGNRRILGPNDTKAKNEKYTKDFQEMVAMIKKLKGTGIFGKYSYLFDLEETLYSLPQQNGTFKKPKYNTYSTDQGGTPFEIITSVLGAEFAKMHMVNNSTGGQLVISAEHTGSALYNQQKGDTFIAYAKSSVNLSQMQLDFQNQMINGKDKSSRVKNIKALEDYLSTVSDQIEHLLVISDKNYTITADWGGASAQEKMSLENARSMLSLFGISGVDGLINYLANCGPDMIQGETAVAEVRQTLVSYIAYFLFDHLQITGQVYGPNVVNILNVGGTYIPLSVFLEGVYESLKLRLNNHRGLEYLVKVELKFGGSAPSKIWSESTWRSFRKGREQKSYIGYHIMMDIADFITRLMKS